MAQIDPSVRVLIADAHSLFREALVSALAGQSDLEVVGEAKDGLEAVSEASRTKPEVAVLDAELPNCDGVRATRLIRERLPGCRVVVLAAEDDHDTIAQALVISPQTARTHIQNVLVKLGVHSRLEAAALAIQNGLSN